MGEMFWLKTTYSNRALAAAISTDRWFIGSVVI